MLFCYVCDPVMEFPSALNKAIQAVGTSKTALAEAINVSQPLIGKYCREDKSGKAAMLPGEDTLRQIVAFFDSKAPDSELGTRLTRAWVRSRLGGELADRVLASQLGHSIKDEQDWLSDVDAEFLYSLKSLVAKGRVHKEIRSAVSALASALSPLPKK